MNWQRESRVKKVYLHPINPPKHVHEAKTPFIFPSQLQNFLNQAQTFTITCSANSYIIKYTLNHKESRVSYDVQVAKLTGQNSNTLWQTKKKIRGGSWEQCLATQVDRAQGGACARRERWRM